MQGEVKEGVAGLGWRFWLSFEKRALLVGREEGRVLWPKVVPRAEMIVRLWGAFGCRARDEGGGHGGGQDVQSGT